MTVTDLTKPDTELNLPGIEMSLFKIPAAQAAGDGEICHAITVARLSADFRWSNVLALLPGASAPFAMCGYMASGQMHAVMPDGVITISAGQAFSWAGNDLTDLFTNAPAVLHDLSGANEGLARLITAS